MRKPVQRLLVTNVLALAISILFSIIALQDKVVPQRFQAGAYGVLGGVIVVCAVFIAIIYLREAIDDFSQERMQHRQVIDADKSRAAIPQYARVLNRLDRLVIDGDGNGELEWAFEMDVLDMHNWDSLEFQIYAEHYDKTQNAAARPFSSNIEVMALQVGKHRIAQPSRAYELKEVRHPANGLGDPMEFGILRVPIDFEDMRTLRQVPINIKMTLKRTFVRAEVGDFFVVEFPQLTDRVRVVIESSDPQFMIVIPPARWDQKIQAQMGYSGTEDVSEALRQKASVRQTDNSIVWESDYPKVGYRYLLHFQMVKAA